MSIYIYINFSYWRYPHNKWHFIRIYIVRYSENSKDVWEKTREIHTPIEIRDITLSNGTYPRIGKIQSWLRKKCNAISLTRAELDTLRQTRNGHVVILRTGTSTDNYQICLSKQDIEQDERTSCVNTTSATQHLQLLLNRFVDTNVPFVVLCLLNTNERGNIMKQVSFTR
jgi:hypothetical protein